MIVAPLHKVKFRVKREAGDDRCRWIPMIKFKIFWFIWSDWHYMSVDETKVVYGDSCLNRCCSMHDAQELIASAKMIFSDAYMWHKREASETAYYDVE